MSELRINRQVRDEVHRQPDGFALLAQPMSSSNTAGKVTAPTKLSKEFVDPAALLEHCIGLQAMAISQLDGERRLPLTATDMRPLPLLKETIRHQRSIALACRLLQAEVMSLRAERDALAIALQHMQTLSLTDELTGLPNRRAFGQRLEQEFSRSQRLGQPLTIVLLDIDNFKGVNDRHGHYVGDGILRCYAQSMARGLRQHDLLARYGGEEFVLLLPDTRLVDARNALDKLSRQIRCASMDADGPCIDLPTFSAGIACLRPGESATALINRADLCLYRAKHLGRNRIETDEPSAT